MTDPAPPLLTFELLDQLEARWRTQGARIADVLRPGLPEARIDELTAPLGLRLPYEARLWWGWHDGADEPLGARTLEYGMTPLLNFAPLNMAAKWYPERREIALDTDMGDADEFWSPTWFPIAQLGNVACECDVEDGAPSPILDVDYHHGDVPGAVAARSFGEMVSWWIEAIDSGWWRFDQTAQRWQRDLDRLPLERGRTGLI